MSTVRDCVAQVVDPELRVVTIEDLGILRDVSVVDGRITVTIRPTYSGCPAMDTIRSDIVTALHEAGYEDVEVNTVLAPPWSTDDISEPGRAKLAAAGIAPPGSHGCPGCGSAETHQISRFGSTPCKALWRCQSCIEPFEHFKAF